MDPGFRVQVLPRSPIQSRRRTAKVLRNRPLWQSATLPYGDRLPGLCPAGPRAGSCDLGHRAARGGGGRPAAGRPGVVRSAAEQAAGAARSAAAAGRGDRRRHEHRQVGDLQPPGRRSGQRRQPAGRRHEAPGVPRAAGLGRSGAAGAAVRAVRAARLAVGRRSAGRFARGSAVLAARADDAAAAAAAGCPRRGFRRGGELAAGPGRSARRPTCWWPC